MEKVINRKGGNVKVELDLSNYATKEDLKKKQTVLIHQIFIKRLIQLT